MNIVVGDDACVGDSFKQMRPDMIRSMFAVCFHLECASDCFDLMQTQLTYFQAN